MIPVVSVVAVYAVMYGVFWATGHFLGTGIQHTILWLVVVATVSYFSADYSDTKRRLKAAECKLQSIPLT